VQNLYLQHASQVDDDRNRRREEGHVLNSSTFISCDVKYFNWSFFADRVGNFEVVLIDPPWRIKGAQQNDSQFMFSNCKFNL
jgi:predicted RNA methylase